MKIKKTDQEEAAGEDIFGREPNSIEFYLQRLLRTVPLHRALVRAAECHLLSAIGFPRPLLDLGAGDGTFAQALFDESLEMGVDPDAKSLQEAHRTSTYRSLGQALGAPLPFKDAAFACVLSNSTLEHIPDVDAVLGEISRVLRPEGILVATVPSERFLDMTLGVRLLRTIRLRPLARLYAGWFNRISRHHHSDPPEVWRERLERAGIGLIEWRYYFDSGSTGAMEAAHYLGAPALLTKRLLGRWVLWPGKVRFLPLAKWLSRWAKPGPRDKGAYLLLIGRKTQ